MLGLGGVELAHWFSLRQILGQALMQAARSGVTQHARPQSIADSFESGLRMAWPDAPGLQRILHEQAAALGTPWHIRITQPTRSAFLDHAEPRPPAPPMRAGLAWISNDHQALRHAQRMRQGWPQGRGPQSGQTIFDANTLALTLNWPQRPVLPGTSAILRALAPWMPDPRQARWMAAGYLPFRRHVRLAMHSHPAQWPDLADGRISHGTHPDRPDQSTTGPAWPGTPISGAAPPAPESTVGTPPKPQTDEIPGGSTAATTPSASQDEATTTPPGTADPDPAATPPDGPESPLPDDACVPAP